MSKFTVFQFAVSQFTQRVWLSRSLLQREALNVRRSAQVVTTAAFLFWGAAPALAVASPASEANAHTKVADTAFDAGDFATAAREYEVAFRETKDVDLLFSQGQALRFLGQFERARNAYSDYVAKAPKAADLAAVRAQIGQLDSLVRQITAAKAGSPSGRVAGRADAVAPNAAPVSAAPPVESAAGKGRGKELAAPAGAAPRVLVLVTEMNGPQVVHAWTDHVWTPTGGSHSTTAVRLANELNVIETTLSDKLTEAGFRVVDVSVLQGKLGAPGRFEKILSDDAARSIGKSANVDLVLVAKGSAQTSRSVANMLSGQANLSARLIRLADGTVLASSTQHAAQVHIDPDTARNNALTEAAKLTAPELIRKAKTP